MIILMGYCYKSAILFNIHCNIELNIFTQLHKKSLNHLEMKDPQFIVKDVSDYWVQMLSVLIKTKTKVLKNIFSEFNYKYETTTSSSVSCLWFV